MIWNTYELSASQLSRVTAIYVVDGYQFGPSWIFGLKMELMACASLVGGTTEQSVIFPDLTCSYQLYVTLMNCLHHTSAVPQPFLLLIAANLALAGFLGWNRAYGLCWLGCWYNGAKLYFYWPYMLVSMIWNTSEFFELHLSRVTAIFIVDCCQFGLSWLFWLKMELMASARLVGGTMEQRCLFPDFTCLCL